jgi:hypothetical protein
MPPPAKLYAYLNIDHPMVAWEVAIGRIRTIDDTSTSAFGVSLWSYSRLSSYARTGNTLLLGQEFRLEHVRQLRHQEKVSRLQGAYFFKSPADALSALERWNVPVNSDYISEIEFYPSTVSEHDSEWITFQLRSNTNQEWMDKYWNGTAHGESPLHEVLALGMGRVVNTQLRTTAYRKIYELWPDSTPLLSAACCGFAAGGLDKICQVKPAILAKDDRVEGSFYIYMKEFDENQDVVVDAIDRCREQGVQPPVVMPKDGTTLFRLPDLRPLSFQIKSEVLVGQFAEVHRAP